MSNKKNFICTTSAETAEQLRSEGLIEIEKQGNRFVFINDASKAEFGKVNKSQITFTNILYA